MVSLRQAINAMCKHCIYDPYQTGTWKQQVRECVSFTCPLYDVRPGSGNKKRTLTLEQKQKAKENLAYARSLK